MVHSNTQKKKTLKCSVYHARNVRPFSLPTRCRSGEIYSRCRNATTNSQPLPHLGYNPIFICIRREDHPTRPYPRKRMDYVRSYSRLLGSRSSKRTANDGQGAFKFFARRGNCSPNTLLSALSCFSSLSILLFGRQMPHGRCGLLSEGQKNGDAVFVADERHFGSP